MSREFNINIDNSIDINLRENLLLEASAGTGKTYSLERVVLNLIKDEKYDLTIRDILVVTFTNKATREMKERIRKILVEEYRSCSDFNIKERLEKAIGEFDEAAIFTIHGFCQNTLQSYPFESFSLFNQEINQDPNLLVGAVWDYLRDFEQKATEQELNEYYSFRGSSAFTDVVAKLIEIYNRDEIQSCTRFYPDQEAIELLENELSLFNNKTGELYSEVQKFKNYNPDLLLQASKSMGSATRISSFEKVIDGFTAIDEDDDFYPFVEKFYNLGICENLFKITTEELESKSKKGLLVADLDLTDREIITGADTIFASLEAVFDKSSLKTNPIDNYLSGEFIKKALKGIDTFFKKKQESIGALSYNDLIDNIHSRIMDDSDRSLLNALRERYKVALIDEFQDTDKKQWDIFGRVFGESERHNFLLIGDPKQSIYRFRGADLEIYYKAKESVKEDNRYFLGTNYRSEAGIVEGVNAVFDPVFKLDSKGYTAKQSFSEVESGKSGNPAGVGGVSQAIEFLVYDREPDAKKDTISAGDCKKGYFDTVVKKIFTLLKDSSKPVNPGEIAILVESHRDSKMLKNRLQKLGIPVVVSKQQNVYRSKEAEHLMLFLKALNRPGGSGEIKALLMSPLFGYSQREVHEMEAGGQLEVVSSEVLLWSQELTHHGLISIWKKLENSSAKGSLQTRMLSTLNGERAYTNYKHLVEIVDKIQKRERLSSLNLYQRLKTLIENASEDEEDSVRLDRESQAVQIMTMHASKGLEFPVVFFAGGFAGSRKRPGGYGIKYADKGGEWTMDFLSGSRSTKLSEKDEWEEKKRLYYVAFTRAVHKLYLPLFPKGELITLSSLYASFNWDENLLKIDELAGDDLECCEQPIHKQLKFKKNNKATKKVKAELPGKLFEDVVELANKHNSIFHVDDTTYLEEQSGFYQLEISRYQLEFNDIKNQHGFSRRYPGVTSYSGLTKDSHGSASKEDADREDEVETVTEVYVRSDEVNNFNIPGGAVFGDLIHEFFEEVEFESYSMAFEEFVSNKDINELYLTLANRHFDADWAKKHSVVCKKIVWNTLNTGLNMDGVVRKLGTFGKGSRIHEREFYFRVDRDRIFTTHNLELNIEEGFLKGFIDLMLNSDGKLYIADWKTTTIKGQEEWQTYNSAAVEKSMCEHNYHLQGLIYTAALYLHLKTTKDNFDYNKHIGGYFYFYVRGMNPDGDTGISFNKPDEEEVLSFLREFRGDL